MSRKTIFISVVGHIALFSAFSFSFGQKLSPANYSPIGFLGKILFDSQVKKPGNDFIEARQAQPLSRYYLSLIRNIKKAGNERIVYTALKPQAALEINNSDAGLEQGSNPASEQVTKRNEPAIILHPLLPYSFGLYFKDRQVAHVELEFKIASSEENNSIMIKRKISSGNLEVDLLTMRYIGHYLFIQQGKFSPDNWHTVKLDLSAKSD